MACDCGSLAESQPCAGAAASLHMWSALSGGQEMPTVSAVSLTANEFPGGGVNVCVFMGVTTSWMATDLVEVESRGGSRERKTREKTQPSGCSENLYTPSFMATKQEVVLSQ